MTIIQCAWCKIILEVKEGVNAVSHGICSACKAKLESEVKKLNKKGGK